MLSTQRGKTNNSDQDREDEVPRPNLNPDIHGSPIWETWNHLASQANTPRRREKLKFWVEEIVADMFGCGNCRNHFPTHLRKFRIVNYMSSAEQMLLHAFLVHDSVTRSIPGKDLSNLPTFADIKKIYFPSKESSCSTVCTNPEDEEEEGEEVEEKKPVTRKTNVPNNMSSQKKSAPVSMSKKVSPTRTLATSNEVIRPTRFVRKT